MFKDMNNDQQDKWIWTFILILCAIVFGILMWVMLGLSGAQVWGV